MKKAEFIKNAIEIINKGGYQIYGIRGLTKNDLILISEGKDLNPSMDDWDNKEICSYSEDVPLLPGTSAILTDIWFCEDEEEEEALVGKLYDKALNYATYYHETEEVALLGGKWGYEDGFDEGEVVISTPDTLLTTIK